MTTGTSSDSTFTFKYDGKEYAATGTRFDTISDKQRDANTTNWELKKAGGKFHQKAHNVVSKDGKTMTVTFKGTDAEGKTIQGTYIYDRQ